MKSQYDVIVIGAGVAGTAAVVSALEEGDELDIAIVDRAPEDDWGGNSRYTDAYMRLNEDGSPIDGFVEDWLSFSDGKVDRELIETIADNAQTTISWLKEKGIEFSVSKSSFPSTNRPHFGPHGGGEAIIETLIGEAKELGVDVCFETTAEELTTTSDGEVDGLIVRGSSGQRRRIQADSVIIASGGFEGNSSMLAQYIWGNTTNLPTVAPGGEYNKGEGITMAESVGGKTAGQFDAFHNEPVDPRSDIPEAAIFAFPYGILVNKNGERFVDEAMDLPDECYELICRKIREQPDEIAYFISDQKLYDIPEIELSIMTDADPYEAEPNYSSDTDPLESVVAALADRIEVDEDGLYETIIEYNDGTQPGEYDPLELDGKRSTASPPKSNWALELDTPPFVAYPIVSSNVFTFGGIGINSSGQVVSRDDRPVKGLYAAGEVTGLYYGKYTGATSVLRGLVFGKIAGKHAANQV